MIEIKKLLKNFLMRLFYIIRNRHKKSAFFMSFSGSQYSDNPRAISEALHLLCPEINIIWAGKDSVKQLLPEYATYVSMNSVKALKAQSQADVWVFNNVLSDSTFKGKRTLYIQTFHGDRGFKRCGYDADMHMGSSYKKHNIRYIENDICNYWITGSQWGEHNASVSYGYNGDFLKVGAPRNDLLLKNSEDLFLKKDAIKRNIGIDPLTKILLYAPTFRDSNRDNQKVDIDIKDSLKKLSKNGEKWVCLIRAHSAAKRLISNEENDVYDVSNYADMVDLLLIADCLITDYSSTACDFVLSKKPVILAQFDYEDYKMNSRAISVDAEQAGFIVVRNQNSLGKVLENIKNISWSDICKTVNDFYSTYESGEATTSVCKVIADWIH